MTVHEHCHTCPKILSKTNSCYRASWLFEGNIFEALFEIIMVFSSVFPYFLFVGMVLYSIAVRTSRGICVFIFLMMQHVLCEALKFGIAQARPPGACSPTFGLPSNHSSFAMSVATWLLLECYFLEKNAPFKLWKYHNILRNAFFIFAPLIAFSRHHLNYHTPGQILAGMSVGFICASSVFAVMYYTIVNKYDYTKSPFYKIWTYFKFQENLTCKQNKVDETPGAPVKAKLA